MMTSTAMISIVCQSDEWQRIGLRFKGDMIEVLVSGEAQGRANDLIYDRGVAGFGCDWQLAWFDDFSVRLIEE